MASETVLPSGEDQASSGIDDLQISLQAEQERTQKKTFTCWINSQLAKHTPPTVVSDLFADIQKGHVLLDLLEALSGQELPRDKGSNTFQCRTNIEHALTFLRNRSIKLINIHVTDIIDGNPSIILGLIWTIILHFHIEKLAQTVSCSYNQPSLGEESEVGSSPTASPPAKKSSKAQARWQMSAKKALLLWAQQQCATYESVDVTDFKSSWRNGMAFLAVIHALRPDLIDLNSVKHRSNRDNLKDAFRIAERELKIPKLLEPEDVDVNNPDEKSIMTYVAQFLKYSKDAPGTGQETQAKKSEDAAAWLTFQEEKLQKAQKDSENESYCKKYERLLSFLGSFNEEKQRFGDTPWRRQALAELNEDELPLRQAWDRLSHQINTWKTKLNKALPSPLDEIEAWLQALEHVVDGDFQTVRDFSAARTQAQEKRTLFKNLMDKSDCHSNTLLAFENSDDEHLPLVPPSKLEEMTRRVNNILGIKCIPHLEMHYSTCPVLGLLDQVKSKWNVWDIKYGSKESVELLLEDWQRFVEEKEFLAQLETSFQKCEGMKLDLAGDGQNISKQHMMLDLNICMYREHLYSLKSALQKVLASWATYVELLRFLKACFEETKKEQIKEVPFETLSQWNEQHTAFNEVGNFLIEVSNDEVGSSISRELRRLNKRWKKFITKTQLDMHLPLIIKQSQSISDHSGNIQPSREDKSTIDFSQDMPIEAPKNHSPHSKAGEEQSTAGEVSPEPLKLGEDVERLQREVGVWETETKSVLDLLGRPDGVEAAAAAADSLQHLLAKGSLYEELVARAEDILQMDVQNILSQESLQYVLSAGLQAKIQEMKEKIQINMIKLAAMLKNSSDASSPEMDVRLKLEESQRELESHITRAAQLLEQRESTSGEISKYKEALMIFNSQSLAKYLKTVEELKSSVTEGGKLSLEERSREVCAKWESIHHELSLYIQQLKVDIEKGKLTETISKLEKQLNKEKKLIRRGRTKGLIKEHEAFFSEEGHLHQLDYHMQVLRELCEELTSQKSQHQVKRALTDYQQKIERLRRSASEIHGALQATRGGVSRDKGGMNSSENGGGDAHSEAPFAKSDNPSPAEKTMEPMADFSPESELTSQHEACTMEEDEKGYSTPINSLLERYDMHRENLEQHLQNDRHRITSDFSSDKEPSGGCLQEKLTDLQALKKETDACWKEFEITSLKLESLVNDMKKPVIAKARDRLKGQEQEFQMALNDRMESLELALQIVSPLEKESLCLCDSDLVLHELAIREFHLKDADSIYQNLKNIQDSLAKQIEICSHFEEPGNSALQALHPLDRRATHHIILNYKAQLEGLGHRVRRSEDALNILEAFLASLRTAELPVELAADCAASETQVLPEHSLTAEPREGSVGLMRDKARHLDRHLKELDISLKDAELGEASSCEKLTDFVSTKFGAQEELRGDKFLEMCVFKNNELLKNLQDVQNQMSKIGLKDPTIPAIKQRKKSLIRVDKVLDEHEDEKKHLQGMAASLPQFKDGREKPLKQRCEHTVLLWENTKASVAECLEQCERALELLKQYHNFKNILITLIQKEENVISLQASYLGKENLKKRIAEIEIVKEEFNEHLEDVDKINQICKNLQFHLNKMSTFEEPPFEKEANSIVDRWLDINEKTEDCYENLGRALALWEKLLAVRNVIDEWIEGALQKVKLPLTEEERQRLKEDLQAQEQELPEVFKRVAEVQFLLQTSEIPLELQMMESLILKKMEYVKMGLAGESRSCAFSGNPEGLREDLDQAKTQIGMTESLLHALSPSDSLEIFTKLEEIQQQILQQKHSMILLENQIGCLTPELSELKKQYESVSDLFNTKKSVLQDHFSTLLNDQCKNFDDWFNNMNMNLKECFDSPETKENLEHKLQKLSEFLTLEGRESKVQQVETVLNQVKKHLPKGHVKELSSWITRQEIELENLDSICQARAKELEDCLQQLLRLQDDHRALSSWLSNQEERWKEMEESGAQTVLACQAFDRKREQFESLAQLNNSLKAYGLGKEEEIIAESTLLTERYQTLLRRLDEHDGAEKLSPVEDQRFHDLAQEVIHWITECKEALMVLNSSEGKMPLEERIQKIKEIILLKPEGDAKLQNIRKQAESSKAPMAQKTLTDIRHQWDNTLHLANTYLSHQEKLLLEGEKYLQSKEALRLMLTELKTKQEAGFVLQNGLQEKKAQLKNYKKFLQKAQDLTSLLKELKSQGNYLLECTKNPNFSEDPWLEIKHLHESLLQQLQDSVQKLEGHVEEHHSFQVGVTDLDATLDKFAEELAGFSVEPTDQIVVEGNLQKLQDLEARLSLHNGALEKISTLSESIKRNSSWVGQKLIEDAVSSLKGKQAALEKSLGSAQQETEKWLTSIPNSKCTPDGQEQLALLDREEPVPSGVRAPTPDAAAGETLGAAWEMNKNSDVEMVLSKQLPLHVQESMKNTEDEQKVNELQNQPLELDLMLRNEQLEEIEKLYNKLGARKAALEPLGQAEHPSQPETRAWVAPRAGSSAHDLDSLLQALITLKETKESQYCLLKAFQEGLAAVDSSLNAFLTDRDSVKTGALDIATYLDKVQKILASIEKEKDSLGKLKIQWENISDYLTGMDKKLLRSQIHQLEHGWEHVEQLVQKKYSQQVVEYDEFNFFMSAIQDLEHSLQLQHQCLQLRLTAPEQQEVDQTVAPLAIELQAIKHRFSTLKGRADLQMKRIWGEKEKKTLENGIHNLQKQLEALEPLNLEVENQIKKCELGNKLEEVVLWVKNLLGERMHTISLLPDDILSQIRRCKVTRDGVLEKQQLVESLTEEVKAAVPHLPAQEASGLTDLLQDLQNQYQLLVLGSAQRSQQLEFKLEERRALFAAMQKAQRLLRENETLMGPMMEPTPTEAELEHQRVALKIAREELQEAESIVSTCFQELANFCKELNVFERLFLGDQLKNLKTRANRTQRFMQTKSEEVDHKLNVYGELREQTSALQKEVDDMQHNELLLNEEIHLDVKEALYNLKDRLAVTHSSLSQVLKLKEMLECIGLNWDFSQLDQLQTQVFRKEKEVEGSLKQLDSLGTEQSNYQASLSKMRALDSEIKQRAEAVLPSFSASPEESLRTAHVLNQKIEKAKNLYHEMLGKLSENSAFDESFREKEALQINLYVEENNKLQKALQNLILASQPQEMNEKDFQDKLANSLDVFNQLRSQLEQPLLINLEMQHIQDEKENCEVLQEQIQAEVFSIKAVTVIAEQREKESASEAGPGETRLRDLEALQTELHTSLVRRTDVLNDTLKNMTHYNAAVAKAVEIVTALETIVAFRKVDLDNPEASLKMAHWKEEEFESTMADMRDLSEKLGAVCSPEAKLQLQHTLQELISKGSAVREVANEGKAEMERCLENYKCYRNTKEKICTDLGKMETSLGQSMSQLPLSYKEALERSEQSKALVTNLLSTKEELMKLRQVLRHLRGMCSEKDGVCLLRSVSALWERWLCLLEAARTWEMWCGERQQDWKFVSEEIEREAIILDDLHEDLPEISKTNEAASTEELCALLDSFCRYEEDVEKQQLVLALLLQSVRSIQNVPEDVRAVETVPALQEIASMQEQCIKLLTQAKKNKDLVQAEIQERDSFKKEIMALKKALQQSLASLQRMESEGCPEKTEPLEELQSSLKKGQLAFEEMMEKSRIKYSEMYTIVPAEIESQMEECRKTLKALDEKISSEASKSSPSYAMTRKIEEINNGLQKVEQMVQQKSKSIEKAQEMQKKMWDELDLWHAKLNELDSEVQDTVEQDPGQAQEWMDNLMIPLQQYQQIAQRAESRTSQLNKATIKMEEYNDLLKSIEGWIENTSLLVNPVDYDSSKMLSQHASKLQMALEDSEQKHNLLYSILSDLEDLSIIFETDDLAQSVQLLSSQVTTLQQRIMDSLPQIQRMADDVVAIETEVKAMEKKVSKIKAILLAKEIFDFSPEENLKHGEVILENLRPMKKTIAEIVSYQAELRLPQRGLKPLPVFQRTAQLVQDVRLLENVAQEQTELLKIATEQIDECDGEIEQLKETLNNYSAEFSPERVSPDKVANLPQVQGEINSLEEQILSLNQKKEELLVNLKTAVLSLHQHLKQEQRESERETLSACAPEEGGVAEREVSDWKLDRAGSMSLLPAVAEEAEEGSVKSEHGDKKAEPSSGSWSLLSEHDEDKEEDRASSSSGTIIQMADRRMSTCDGSVAQGLAPDSLNLHQTKEGATPPIQAASLDVPGEHKASEATVEHARPEPAEVLYVCQTQVAELEQWLAQANVAFEPETLNPGMQQVVEQQLVGCQAMLTEIEHKVVSLLENCKDQGLGDGGAIQQEAEALSLKLKTVKCNLEKVQMMLQEKYSEDQQSTIGKKASEHEKALQPDNLSAFESMIGERPLFSRHKDVQRPQVPELKPVEQKEFIKFIELNVVKKTRPQYSQRAQDPTQESSLSEASSSQEDAPDVVLSAQGPSGDKWQYLQHELSSKICLPFPQLVEPQVSPNISILPSVGMYSFSYPTTEELQAYTTQLEDLRQEANTLQAQENLTEETYVNMDKKVFDLLLTLSQCLRSMEEMLQTPALFRGDMYAQQVHYEALALELKKLSLAVSNKKGELSKAVTCPGQNPSLFLECFSQLQERLEHVQATAAARSKSLRAGLDHHRSYQAEMKRLYDQLIKNKTSLQQSLNEISSQSVDKQLQKVDVHTAELHSYENRVAKLRDEGERLHLPHSLLQEVYKLEDILDDMWAILRGKYSELRNPSITEIPPDALWQGLVELVAIGKEKLAHGHLQQTKSQAALRAHLQNHKDFFQKLVADMVFIQTYSNKRFPSLLQKKEKFGAEFHFKEVKLLEEKSQEHGMKLQSLLQKWEDFDENYASLEKELEILVSTLPSVSLVEETEERLMERISFYQQIKRNIDEKHARLYQTLNEGRQLMAAVSCPELEGQISKLEEQWLSLNKKIDHELHRLQTLLKHLVSYNRDSDEFTQWLESSQQTLNSWKEQSSNVSQDLDTIRSNIDHFFEFSKEVDGKSSLKTAVVSTGNQLLHLKEADAAALRASLAQFDQKWAMLITQLPDIQEKLHQLQMEKLPSRQAITETICWMSGVEHQIPGEESEHSPSSASQLKNLLHVYKEFRMEMDYKQWIVDFVNQSLLQLSTCDVESKRYERTEFAEHLGEMNRQWHRLHGLLNRKIQHLEQLLESISENENKIQMLNSWMEAQEERLKTLQRPGGVVSVQKTLLDCQDIENQLALKSKSLDELRESHLTLESGSVPLLEDTASAIDGLFQKRTSVINQVHQLKASMQSVLQEWRMYEELYDEVTLLTIRFWYCMEHSKPVVVSLEALRCQVQSLQALQDEAENSEGSWEKLQEVLGKLKNHCPSTAEIIEEKYQNTHTRWTQVNQAIADELQGAQSLLQLWKAYNSAHAEATARLEQEEAKFHQLTRINLPGSNLPEVLLSALQDIKELQRDVQHTGEALLQHAPLLERLPQLSAEPCPPALLSGRTHALQKAAYLEKMLLVKADEFEFLLSQFKDFENRLESLQGLIKQEEENLDELYQKAKEGNPDAILVHVLSLTAQSPDIERLNEVSLKLPLSDMAVKTLQNVNRQWVRATATALERCSDLQGVELNEKFLHCCGKWALLLQKIEEMLKVNLASDLPGLLEQQKSYEMLEAEVSVNQTIADSLVTQTLQLLDTAEVEERSDFVLKFVTLKDQWHSAAQRVQQRKGDINEQVRQWHNFNASVEDLLRFLTDTSHLLSAATSLDCCSLSQTRRLIQELKSKEIGFQRRKTTYELTLEAGEKLLSMTNLDAKESVTEKIQQLQGNWKDTELQVGEMMKHFQAFVETWDRCEKKIKELKSRLQVLKAKSKEPLPELHEDLHKEKELLKELEKSLAAWALNLEEVRTMKTELAGRILWEDVVLLKEHIAHLHRQWEDLCCRVAVRKQEIEDRLNSWAVFTDKNKDLCAWLVQMENKVLQTADISIEEMIEKLQKDCMEEINMFTENKLQLKQMGDQLIKASSKTRAAEVDDKLSKVNDRWQHLFDVIGSRVKKLKETFAFIQQLDKSMSNLRTWLARIESELSKPVVYDVCDDQEIQKRLAEQQDLQRDIEQHSAGVESVFSICDVLLRDSDACANETECDSIQQTTRSLDRRWRNICAMSMERRMKIEETWRLWQKFLDDYSRFEDWLDSAERLAAYPNSSEVLYTIAKEELKRCEAFQRQIHERLTQLELINKQYRRLARENRTDTASRLKQMVHEGNQRWDNLQKRVAAVLRRLRHFTNQREEFEGTRESILVWLTEMDLQLTNVEHFSESDADDKMRQLNGFQQEITLNTNKIDQLIVFGEQLIQKSEPLDAVLIEDELEEVHRYCQEVFGRVSRFHRRLTTRAPGLEDEKEASENETDLEDSREIPGDAWCKRGEREGPSSPQSLCQLMPPAPGHERSGCETPVSVDSIPLEWDHTGDVGGSSSPEDDEEGPYYSALSDVEIPENPEAYLKMTTKTLKASSGQSLSESHSWHVPDSPSCHTRPYKPREGDRNVPPIPSDASTPYKPDYAKLLLSSGTTGGKEDPRGVSCSPQQEDAGQAGQQSGAFERWELIQPQELHHKRRMKQNLQQLNSDISTITAWLRNTEAELETLQTAPPAPRLEELELRVKRLKEIVKAFGTSKALMASVNSSSKEFLLAERTEPKDLQNRLHQLSLHWEAAQGAVDHWREGLRQSLMQCQDFREVSQSLLLWLESTESRRQEACATDPRADPQALRESQAALTQLEQELRERQPQVNSLQELSSSLLSTGHGQDYVEADEKVHVIGKKFQQLLEKVSQDLISLQGSQNPDPSLPSIDRVDSRDQHPAANSGSATQAKRGAESTAEGKAQEDNSVPGAGSSRPQRSFLSRVIRVALPLQLLLLLLLLLACLLPTSEEDYSCAQANNFARSFYPMLRYTNGPPPT